MSAVSPAGSADALPPADEMAALRVLAEDLAEVSAAAIRPRFRQPMAVDEKADCTPVTAADRDSEQAMRDLIGRRRPDHGVIGEEHGRDRAQAEWVWVLDPIDGTGAFISGLATFGTLIGLLYRGRPVLGVINQPVTGERWVGLDAGGGQVGCWFAGRPATTRPCGGLDRATLFTTGVELFDRPKDAAGFERLRAATRLRRYGCDCYAYGLLAAGFADIVCEAGLKLHDYAALAPVVIGAGGAMTDWEGRPLTLESGDRVLAVGDPRLHAPALALLRGEG